VKKTHVDNTNRRIFIEDLNVKNRFPHENLRTVEAMTEILERLQKQARCRNLGFRFRPQYVASQQLTIGETPYQAVKNFQVS
jgi:hypothetical protein